MAIRLLAGLAALTALGVAAAVAAAPALPARAPALEAVGDCRKIEDSAQRLACYDKAVDAMVEAENNGDLVSIDRAQRRAVRRQAFGFSIPSLAILDRGAKPDELNQITETVAAAYRTGEGRWVVRMQDASVWRQVDDAELGRDPHAGSNAVIRRGMLGSFFMDLDGQPGVRVHRDD